MLGWADAISGIIDVSVPVRFRIQAVHVGGARLVHEQSYFIFSRSGLSNRCLSPAVFPLVASSLVGCPFIRGAVCRPARG